MNEEKEKTKSPLSGALLSFIETHQMEVASLTEERDRLRKEVQRQKETVSKWHESWTKDTDSLKQEISRLRDQFQWKPISIPPTEKDAAEIPAGKCVIWGNQRGEWLDHWNAIFSAAQYPPTHWRHLNFPPLPESKEDDSRKEFETWWYSTDPDSSRPDMMDISQEAAWTIWRRSRKSFKQP